MGGCITTITFSCRKVFLTSYISLDIRNSVPFLSSTMARLVLREAAVTFLTHFYIWSYFIAVIRTCWFIWFISKVLVPRIKWFTKSYLGNILLHRCDTFDRWSIKVPSLSPCSFTTPVMRYSYKASSVRNLRMRFSTTKCPVHTFHVYICLWWILGTWCYTTGSASEIWLID